MSDPYNVVQLAYERMSAAEDRYYTARDFGAPMYQLERLSDELDEAIADYYDARDEYEENL